MSLKRAVGAKRESVNKGVVGGKKAIELAVVVAAAAAVVEMCARRDECRLDRGLQILLQIEDCAIRRRESIVDAVDRRR